MQGEEEGGDNGGVDWRGFLWEWHRGGGCGTWLCRVALWDAGEGFREETDGRENKLRDEVSSAGMRLPKLGWLFKGDKTFPFMVFFGRQQRTGRLGLRA